MDKDRIVSKLDELDGYLRDIQKIAPATFAEYKKVMVKRTCERLIQLAVECVIDICRLLVTGLRLGLPSEENDIFEKLCKVGIISRTTASRLKKMRGFRNILVHEYGDINDELVYGIVKKRLPDFHLFKVEILRALRSTRKAQK